MVGLFFYNLGEIPGFCLFQEPLEEPWQDQPFLPSHRALLDIRRFSGRFPANRWSSASHWILSSVWRPKLSRVFGRLPRVGPKSAASYWEQSTVTVLSR